MQQNIDEHVSEIIKIKFSKHYFVIMSNSFFVPQRKKAKVLYTIYQYDITVFNKFIETELAFSN